MVRLYETITVVVALILDIQALLASAVAFQAHAEAREPPYDILEHNRLANKVVKIELVCLAGLVVALLAGGSYLCLLAAVPPVLIHLRRWTRGELFFTSANSAMRLKREDRLETAKVVLYTILFIAMVGQLAIYIIY